MSFGWASLVAQWLRVCLPMQGTRVRALVWEDPACHGATGPVSHNYRACASGALLRNKRNRDSERPAHRDEECRSWRKPSRRNEDPTQPPPPKKKKKLGSLKQPPVYLLHDSIGLLGLNGRFFKKNKQITCLGYFDISFLQELILI